MVDFQTYTKLHPESKGQLPKTDFKFAETRALGREDLSADTMCRAEPPSEPGIYVFPSTVVAYNLRQKKWGKVQ